MDRATRTIRRAFFVVLGGLFAVTTVTLVHADSSPHKVPSLTPPSGGFGMVPYRLNIGPYDPGLALSKKTSPFYPSRASTGGRKVKPSDFDPPEVCGGCHTEIYKQWNGSMHSKAWKDPLYRAALTHLSKETHGKVDLLCEGCHTPIGTVTGQANPAGVGMAAIDGRGVQCAVCHNISDTHGIGNGAYILTPKLDGRHMQFGPYKDAKSPYHDTVYSALHTRSEFCGQCHNVSHPFNWLQIERTYSEWKDSTYAGQGIQCQDCHMKPKRAKVTPFSKERPNVYTHYFVGGNAIITKLLGSNMHAQIARQMLKSAATVKIMVPQKLVRGTMARVDVKVTNVGAGHKLPTGFPEGREMWLDFKVMDNAGHTVYRLGQVKNGATEPNTHTFKVTLGDKNGNPVPLELLQADRILSDTRIPPKGASTTEYDFMVGQHVKGPLHIEAQLNYWSISPALIKQLMGNKAPKIPIIKMTSAQTKVALTSAPPATNAEKVPGPGVQKSMIKTRKPSKSANARAARKKDRAT